ncbi:MAG: hypothetical protein Q8Q76_05285 [Methylotenera sp.]|nr:hypothetical protein [Methylotenera sp.]
MNRVFSLPSKQPLLLLLLFLLIAASIWLALYQALIPLSECIVQQLPVTRDSKLGSALQF